MSAPRDVRATSRDGTRVHGLEWGGGDAPALIFVPGGTGNAWAAERIGTGPEGSLGRARRVLGISRRGMGLSDSPAAGYTPAHFADDVDALVRAAGIERFVLFGHSMGAPISIEYALRRPAGLQALVLGDAPARYLDFAASGTFDQLFTRPFEFADWDEAFAQVGLGDRARFDRVRHRYLHERGGKVAILIDPTGLRRTVDESRTAHTEYWDRLREITVPVLLLRATSGWSPLTDGDARRYIDALPALKLAPLPTAHDLGLNTDTAPLFAALGTFLDEVDARALARRSYP
ncbi:MAG TPA: alpha/beta hydrolase [Candidatus Limnocylindria bacterium]|nr:alpha/beta hydrolase [Candidatus Limnocylindria bacterium]